MENTSGMNHLGDASGGGDLGGGIWGEASGRMHLGVGGGIWDDASGGRHLGENLWAAASRRSLYQHRQDLTSQSCQHTHTHTHIFRLAGASAGPQPLSVDNPCRGRRLFCLLCVWVIRNIDEYYCTNVILKKKKTYFLRGDWTKRAYLKVDSGT